MSNSYNSNVRRYVAPNMFHSRTYAVLAGTASVTLGDATRTITGVLTTFLTDLQIGDLIMVGTERFTIESVTNNLQAIATLVPTTNQAGQPVQRFPSYPLPLPPALLRVNAGSSVSNFVTELTLQQLPIEANVGIRRLGLFCNFADGLVFADPRQRFLLDVQSFGATEITLPGSVNFTLGNPFITGVGFLALAPGDVIIDSDNHPYTIDTVYNDTTALLTQFSKSTSVAFSLVKLALTSSLDFQLPEVAVLNYMYEAECYFPVANFLVAGNTRILIQLTTFMSDATTDFYTITVDPAFVGAQLIFDAHVDLEITPTF